MTTEPQPTRAPLGIVTAEGALATVFNVLTTGTFLTGLALLWGANDFQIGLLAAIPFLTPVVQILAAYLIDRTGSRKQITVINSAVGRQVWWLLIPFLFIPFGLRVELLIVIVALCSIAMNVFMVGWTSWMADLVAEKNRGRFFGTRNQAVGAATLLATMAGGVILDSFRNSGHEITGFAVILAVAGAFSLAAVLLLKRIPDRPVAGVKVGWQHLTEPLRKGGFRRLLRVFFVWQMAIGISAAFFVAHMLTNLGMSFTMIAAYECAAAVMAILMNRPWGALIDRFGCKPVIVVTAFGAAVLPIVWLFPTPGFLWLLIPEILLKATLLAGFNLAMFNIPIAHSPEGRRTTYLAAFSMITGLAFFGASTLGGVLAESWSGLQWQIGGRTIVNYHLLFVISALMRLGGAFYAMTLRETENHSVPEMVRYMATASVRSFGNTVRLFTHPPRLRPAIRPRMRPAARPHAAPVRPAVKVREPETVGEP